MRSLRSKERDIIQSRNESLEEKLQTGDDNEKQHDSEEGTPPKESDNATGVYIGQLDNSFKEKHGIGVRIYLKEVLNDDKVAEEQIMGVYEGQWKDNMREGRGFEIYKNRDIYFGSFKDNRRHGQGSLYKVTKGETYKGEWY